MLPWRRVCVVTADVAFCTLMTCAWASPSPRVQSVCLRPGEAAKTSHHPSTHAHTLPRIRPVVEGGWKQGSVLTKAQGGLACLCSTSLQQSRAGPERNPGSGVHLNQAHENRPLQNKPKITKRYTKWHSLTFASHPWIITCVLHSPHVLHYLKSYVFIQ